MSLKCPMPKCKASVNGVTGFDELQRFGKHLRVKHGQFLDTNKLLELRLIAEAKQELTPEKFAEWLAKE